MDILKYLAAIASQTVAQCYKHAAIPLNQTKLKLIKKEVKYVFKLINLI